MPAAAAVERKKNFLLLGESIENQPFTQSVPRVAEGNGQAGICEHAAWARNSAAGNFCSILPSRWNWNSKFAAFRRGDVNQGQQRTCVRPRTLRLCMVPIVCLQHNPHAALQLVTDQRQKLPVRFQAQFHELESPDPFIIISFALLIRRLKGWFRFSKRWRKLVRKGPLDPAAPEYRRY